MSGEASEPAVRAGEYVLGLLDPAEMRQMEAQAQHDASLAAEIAFWEDSLVGLAALVPPVAAPAVLWSRLALAAGIGGDRRRAGSARIWQGATIAALAVAAGFAFLAFLPRPAAPNLDEDQFVAALGPVGTAVPFLAQARADGSIAITRLTSATAPTGRDFQLWALPKGATKPISLGVLADGKAVVHPSERPLAETQLLVSDEPAGGSPTGQPTGAVLYGGSLTPASAPGQ